MRTRIFLFALAACAGTTEPRPSAPLPPQQPDQRSYTDRITDARHHDQRADQSDRVAQSAEQMPVTERFSCGDTVLNDQLTTGGVGRVTSWTPCFDVAEEQAEHERFVAQNERLAADHDRRAAQQLVDAQVTACRDVPEREREHSVFAHRKAIARIEAVKQGDTLQGVRVVFKPVRGLTADFVRKDIACTRARWATFGHDAQMAPYDPTLIDGADVQVIDRGTHAEVVVTAGSADAADIALARARGELTAEK